jgi:hypothetical protein
MKIKALITIPMALIIVNVPIPWQPLYPLKSNNNPTNVFTKTNITQQTHVEIHKSCNTNLHFCDPHMNQNRNSNRSQPHLLMVRHSATSMWWKMGVCQCKTTLVGPTFPRPWINLQITLFRMPWNLSCQ